MDFNQPSSHEDIQKVDGLWFEDADVIFQAGEKQFRVHRGILSARSSVFRDMFSIPQPTSTSFLESERSKAPASCQIIHLPDAPTEVHYFFLAIFDSSFFEPPPSPTSIEILNAILRLSHKYDVGYLLRRAVSHLNPMFPIDTQTFFTSLLSPSKGPPNLNDDAVKLSLLNLVEPAHKASIRWILPALLRWAINLHLIKVFKSTQWSELPIPRQHEYLMLREAVMSQKEVLPQVMSRIPLDSCLSPTKCTKSTRDYLLNRRKLNEECARWIPGSRPNSEMARAYCQVCFNALVSSYQRFASATWKKCPMVLHLPDWETLKKEKEDFENTR